MNNSVNDLTSFLLKHTNMHPGCSKDELARVTEAKFNLSKARSVYYGPYFAIRFSSIRGKSFSNVVLSLSALKIYDSKPFVVCVVSPKGIKLLLANTTFLKKISHSSQKLSIDNIRGSFLGHDIMQNYENLENKPENFEILFDIHCQFTWQQNIERLVEKTNAIFPTGTRFKPSLEQLQNIMKSPETANRLSQHSDYILLGEELSQIVQSNTEAILRAGEIDNINQRGNAIEQIITSSGNLHGIEDFTKTLQLEMETEINVKIDVKTKNLALNSNPKGYNIDKILELLSVRNTVFCFFFLGVDLKSQNIVTRLVSMFDYTILNSTHTQPHWAGRNSRGATQLSGDLSSLFSPDFRESINVNEARDFLQKLIDMPPFSKID
jgi:hypothetical protein